MTSHRRQVGRGQGDDKQGNGAGLGPHSDTAAASTLTAATPVSKTLVDIWAQRDFDTWRDHQHEGS